MDLFMFVYAVIALIIYLKHTDGNRFSYLVKPGVVALQATPHSKPPTSAGVNR